MPLLTASVICHPKAACVGAAKKKRNLQDWSKCVDEHREGEKDFTEECKDAVCIELCSPSYISEEELIQCASRNDTLKGCHLEAYKYIL